MCLLVETKPRRHLLIPSVSTRRRSRILPRSAAFLLASCKELRGVALEANVWETVRGVLVKAYGEDCPGADPNDDEEAAAAVIDKEERMPDDWRAEVPAPAGRCPYPLAELALADRHSYMVEYLGYVYGASDWHQGGEEIHSYSGPALADDTPLADILGCALCNDPDKREDSPLQKYMDGMGWQNDRYTSRALLSEFLRARYDSVPALRRGLGLGGKKKAEGKEVGGAMKGQEVARGAAEEEGKEQAAADAAEERWWKRFMLCWASGRGWITRDDDMVEAWDKHRSCALQSALESRGLYLRHDSRLCSEYIHEFEDDRLPLLKLVDMMSEMDFLVEHAGYERERAKAREVGGV
jgi:hypothetical protein